MEKHLQRRQETISEFCKSYKHHINAFLGLWLLSGTCVVLNIVRKQVGALFVLGFEGENASFSPWQVLLTSAVSVVFGILLSRHFVRLNQQIHKKQSVLANQSKIVEGQPEVEIFDDDQSDRQQRSSTLTVPSSDDVDCFNTSGNNDDDDDDDDDDRVVESSDDCIFCIQNTSVLSQSLSVSTQTSETLTTIYNEGKATVSVGVMTSTTQACEKGSNTSHRPHSIARGVGTFSNGALKKKIRRAQKSFDEVEGETRTERREKTKEWRSTIHRFHDKLVRLIQTTHEKSKLMGFAFVSRMASQKEVENTALSVRSLREKLNQQCEQNEKQVAIIKTKTAILKTMTQFIGSPKGTVDTSSFDVLGGLTTRRYPTDT